MNLIDNNKYQIQKTTLSKNKKEINLINIEAPMPERESRNFYI